MSYLLLAYDVSINYDMPTTITPNWWLWHQLITNVKIFTKENSNNIFVKKMKNVLKYLKIVYSESINYSTNMC
jgi:hypothetical protein